MAAVRRTLDPKLDIVFWMLFGEERNRPLLSSLLSAVLRPASPIDQIQILHPEPERPVSADKTIALDLRVKLTSGEQVDVEMQTQRRPALAERLLYYWARLYAGQLSRGDDYTELRRCAVVAFVTFPMLLGPRFHSVFSVRERYSAALFSDQLEVHVLELPKLKAALAKNEEPLLALWGRFLAATTDEELEQLAMEDPVLKQAKEALDALSADPKARIQAEMRETAFLAYKAELGASRREGRLEGKAEGKLEGRLEGKLEALRELLTLKFGAISPDLAERLRVATEPQLDAALKRVLAATNLDDVFPRLSG